MEWLVGGEEVSHIISCTTAQRVSRVIDQYLFDSVRRWRRQLLCTLSVILRMLVMKFVALWEAVCLVGRLQDLALEVPE